MVQSSNPNKTVVPAYLLQSITLISEYSKAQKIENAEGVIGWPPNQLRMVKQHCI